MKTLKRIFFIWLPLSFTLLVPSVQANGPSARIDYGMAPYPPSGGILMHGGWSDATGWTPSSELWKLDYNGWTSVTGTGAPAFAHHSMTYDSGRQVVVLCGATSGSPTNYETWEYNGTSWTQGPNVSVGITGDVEIAYDAGRRVTVLYGADPGWKSNPGPPEVWEYDGSIWTQKNYSHTPVSCGDGALLAYDGANEHIVLVGNPNNPFTEGQFGTETWTWNGNDWSPVTGAQPEYAVLGGMAYDRAHQQLVLLATDMNTWTFNGTDWTKLTPTTSPTPSPNAIFNITYDATMKKVVMFGGESSGSVLNYPTTTWLWNGSTWSEFVPGPNLLPLENRASFDSSLNIIAPAVDFGGNCFQLRFNLSSNPADPWNYYWVLDLGSVAFSQADCDSYSATLSPTDFQLRIPYLGLQQNYYQTVFDFSPNPADPANLYWKLDLSSVSVSAQ